jgi:hypothetical protein
MAWYKTGTVSVTNASTAVVGVGTDFVTNAQVGQLFYIEGEQLYEIAAIVSSTSLTLAAVFDGSTASTLAYAIVPTSGLTRDLATEVSALISSFSTVRDEAGAGLFAAGSAASPAISFVLDQDTGLYNISANVIGVAVSGTKVAQFDSTGLNNAVIGATTAAALTATTGTFSSVLTGLTVEATGDTSAGDNAAMGYTATEGLVLTGQGSTNDVTIKNDADATVMSIATGTTNATFFGDVATGGRFILDNDKALLGNATPSGSVIIAKVDTNNDVSIDPSGFGTVFGGTATFAGDVTGLTLNATGGTSAGDNAAMGYSSTYGAMITGQGSTYDTAIFNDANTAVMGVLTGTQDVRFWGRTLSADGSAASPSMIFRDDGDTGVYRPTTNQWAVATGGTNALTLDASQNATFAGSVAIDGGASSTINNTSSGSLLIKNNGTTKADFHSNGNLYLSSGMLISYGTGTSTFAGAATFAGDITSSQLIATAVGIGGIISSTALGITFNGVTTFGQKWNDTNAAAGTHTPLTIIRNGSTVGTITTSTTATAYNTSSDPRLKTDFIAINSNEAYNLIEQAHDEKIIGEFAFKTDPTTKVWGYNAHKALDLQAGFGGTEGDGSRDLNLGDVYEEATYETVEVEVTPAVLDEECVEITPAVMGTEQRELTPEKLVTPAGIDQSKRVPMLEAAIYQLIQDNKALTLRLEALENV